jgi:hypothetical protein
MASDLDSKKIIASWVLDQANPNLSVTDPGKLADTLLTYFRFRAAEIMALAKEARDWIDKNPNGWQMIKDMKFDPENGLGEKDYSEWQDDLANQSLETLRADATLAADIMASVVKVKEEGFTVEQVSDPMPDDGYGVEGMIKLNKAATLKLASGPPTKLTLPSGLGSFNPEGATNVRVPSERARGGVGLAAVFLQPKNSDGSYGFGRDALGNKIIVAKGDRDDTKMGFGYAYHFPLSENSPLYFTAGIGISQGALAMTGLSWRFGGESTFGFFTAGWIWQQVDGLDRVSVGDQFSGDIIPTRKVLKGAFGLSFSFRL